MRLRRRVPILLLMCAVALSGWAQRRDPLNDKEIDEMREAADYPDKRLELMVNFSRARINAIDQLRADPKAVKDRPMQVHDLLQDFTALLDEIGDNVDVYSSRHTDMRKGL